MTATHDVAIQYGKLSAESTDTAKESACENARKAHFRGTYKTTYQERRRQEWQSTSSLYQRMMTMFGAVETIGYLQDVSSHPNPNVLVLLLRSALKAEWTIADDCKYFGLCVEEFTGFLA
jgi:hypothetical protein